MTEAVLGVALLAALALVYLQARDHAKERAGLLDRIQAPEAAIVAAFSRAAVPAESGPNTDAEDDKAFGRDITEDLEIDWIPLGMDE